VSQPQVASHVAPYVFVSYAHVDLQIVHPYVSSLERQGLKVWWDQGLTPGREWVQEIADAIFECSVFLLLVTRGVVDSEYCFRETFFAQNERIPTIVSFVQSVRLPHRLRFLLSSIHAVSDSAGECNRLADTLHRALTDSRTRRPREPLEFDRSYDCLPMT